MQEHHLRVQRTARYHVLGDIRTAKALWIVVHGYGQLARFFLNNFEEVGEELFIVAPEGLSRFYLDPEHQRVGATWMTREDRLHEIGDHVTYLDRLVDVLLQQHSAPIAINALGFSQGVATVARWAMKGNTKFDRLVFWAGSLPPELDQGALQAWRSLEVDLVLGEQDPLIKAADVKAAFQRLTSAGIAVQMHNFKGAHALDKMLLSRLMNDR